MNKTTSLLIIRQSSSLRAISEDEVLEILTPEESQLRRYDMALDMQQYPIDGGVWDESEQYILQRARDIRQLADEKGAVRILFFGLAEVPHVLALGAYLGDQRKVEVYDFSRDRDSWQWSETDTLLQVKANQVPSEVVTQSGSAVIRVEISYAIADEDVDQVVGKDRLADIRIQLEGEQSPMVASTVRSAKDVQLIRETFRKALADLIRYRPNVNLIHLFVSAPAPVCFVIGQELQLRNNVPVQTYRFRRIVGEPANKEAILLTAEEAESATVQLSAEQKQRAADIRTRIWPQALQSVIDYAASLREESEGREGPWYSYLRSRAELSVAKPFPQLPPIWEVVQLDDTVDTEPYTGGEYGHTNDSNRWRLSDTLLIGLSDACRDDYELTQLIRLFLFHEYLHSHHSLTKYNAEGVGRFANVLERLDYMADLYALLHQLDYMLHYERQAVISRQREFLTEQLDLILRSTWAFIPGLVVNRWQVRSIRRLLNWYWRHVQVQQSRTLSTTFSVLAQPPAIELIGPMLSVGGGRIYASMTHLDPTVELSLGMVLENAKFLRILNGMNSNLPALMDAFRTRQHQAIKIFFLGVFETAKQLGGALPN
ncbi:SAVED domain-containing protein [Fibrella forsythiae]|uniref:SAVED domain-containing protein n=1 Tax=Fibrella forsythiae TaxID=2817061 RepID=A0ABS3JP38_9BACT|nr:SAVED domain-containing protein [Fibrella forsythiae]MBO0951181.1 SAVED domain-containing protein [Fibrella forsythiae]